MIALASDHAGLDLKNEIALLLEQKSLAFHDYGTYTGDSCDYVDFAKLACEAVASGEAEKAILICGTGAGMSMTANKVRGIRAVCCSDCFTARLSRLHNDANVLCMGARVVGSGLAKDMVCAFLTASFEGGERHTRRVGKINEMDNQK